MAMPPSTITNVSICGSSSVAPIAIAMPIMPTMLPVRALSGEASPLIASTKQMADTR